jgi:hypothetical protein
MYRQKDGQDTGGERSKVFSVQIASMNLHNLAIGKKGTIVLEYVADRKRCTG